MTEPERGSGTFLPGSSPDSPAFPAFQGERPVDQAGSGKKEPDPGHPGVCFMPTYDYECSSCGHRFELFQSITAKPQKRCPSCERRTAKRLIGAGAGIIFKGSGFYETDYRSESYKKAAKAEADSASGGDKKKSGSDGTKEKKAVGESSKKSDD